ncbi:hypothetical protein [Streptomyces sp. BRA346]|uniref:hypothetical protein n=1 Tax=Streptomyces sp. BRA346 TaxID=2878199 RepID=UPI0040630A55
MTTTPNPASTGRPTPTAGWDEATFRCGRCGARRTATTEDTYHQMVAVHSDAHELMERLNPIERDGLASILRVVLAAPELGAEFLALIDHLKQTAASTRSTEPHDDPQKRR